jgi:hypothetical protein
MNPRDLLAEAALEGATGVIGELKFSSFTATESLPIIQINAQVARLEHSGPSRPAFADTYAVWP